jgi:ArsR family transcriptional regulator
MKILTETGIVIGRPEGKWTHYSISEEGRAYAIALLKELTRPVEAREEKSCC